MSDVAQARVIIRHVSGSKTNQVEQIPLKDLREITLGRDPSSTIAFDQQRDDVVSRRHAVIRIGTGGNPAFHLSDIGSSNGTFLNGQAVTEAAELAPEDIVELGKGGPRFSFDVQPRPAGWASRTRVIDALDNTVTRAIATISADGLSRPAIARSAPKDWFGGTSAGLAEVRIGKDTVLRMLTAQRQSTSRMWIGSAAAVFIVFGVIGAGVHRHNLAVESQVNEVAQQSELAAANAGQVVNDRLGMMATEVNQKYANSTVYIHVQWRLFDQETGRPLFQKTVFDRSTNSYVPAFVRTSKGVVRWLTLEDEDKTNIPIMEGATGSGFVVGSNGFILTNKHVAAGWMIPFENIGQDQSSYGLVYPYDFNIRSGKVEKVKLNAPAVKTLKQWYPEDGAYVFDAHRPIVIGGGTQVAGDIGNARVFIGRDELLEVRFPGDRMSLQATLVRASTDSDTALIKIDAPQTLKAVELTSDDRVQVGDRAFVLGYPAVSEKTYVVTQTNEAGVSQTRLELVPEPTLTEGIVSHLGVSERDQGGANVHGSLDDAFQLSINATGAGNSGGPVFNGRGHVIGMFTYARDLGGARVSFAVPIKYGRDLMQLQRANAD